MRSRHAQTLFLLPAISLIALLALPLGAADRPAGVARDSDCVPRLNPKTQTLQDCGFGYVQVVSLLRKPPEQLSRREQAKLKNGRASTREGIYNLLTGAERLDMPTQFPGSYVVKLTFAGFPFTAFVEFSERAPATAFVGDVRGGGKNVDLSDCVNEVAGLVCYKRDEAPALFSELDFAGNSVRYRDGVYHYDIRGQKLVSEGRAVEGEFSEESTRQPASGAKPVKNAGDETESFAAPGAPLGQ
jgi:hypothetical protein